MHCRRIVYMCGFFLAALVGCQPELPPGPLRIQITGENYYWHFRYPGFDGQLQTDDDIVVSGSEFHVPVDWDIELEFASRDYIYIFALPLLQLNQVAIPDMVFELAFKAEVAGPYTFAGDQLCGISHESLNGRLIAEAPADFINWLAQQKKAAAAP